MLAQIEGKDWRKYFLNIGEIVVLPGIYQSLIMATVNDFYSLQSGMSYQVISYVMRPLNLIENLQKKCRFILKLCTLKKQPSYEFKLSHDHFMMS